MLSLHRIYPLVIYCALMPSLGAGVVKASPNSPNSKKMTSVTLPNPTSADVDKLIEKAQKDAQKDQEKSSDSDITKKVEKARQVGVIEKRHSSVRTCPNILQILEGKIIGSTGDEKNKIGLEKLANPKYTLVNITAPGPYYMKPYVKEAGNKFSLVRTMHESRVVLYAVRFAKPQEASKLKLDLDKLRREPDLMVQSFNNDACVLNIKSPETKPSGRKELVWLYHVAPIEEK